MLGGVKNGSAHRCDERGRSRGRGVRGLGVQDIVAARRQRVAWHQRRARRPACPGSPFKMRRHKHLDSTAAGRHTPCTCISRVPGAVGAQLVVHFAGGYACAEPRNGRSSRQ